MLKLSTVACRVRDQEPMNRLGIGMSEARHSFAVQALVPTMPASPAMAQTAGWIRAAIAKERTIAGTP
jgi:hypothetical protein